MALRDRIRPAVEAVSPCGASVLVMVFTAELLPVGREDLQSRVGASQTPNLEKSSGVPELISGTLSNVGTAPETLTLGERIAYYRKRRGMSQAVLAGLVGRTENWLSKVENNKIEIDRVSVITMLAENLGLTWQQLLCAPIADQPTSGPWPSARDALEQLRTTLADYSHLTGRASATEPVDLDVLKAQIGDAWSAYQDSRYARATRLLPPVISAARLAVNCHEGETKLTAQGLLAMAYQGAAMVLTKVGESDLAWLAADRGLSAADQSENLLICGSLYRSVAHCLLATAQFDAGRLDAAAGVVDNAATFLAATTDRSDPSHLSIYGTLLLVGSMAAARAGDRIGASKYLAVAGNAAQSLGYDGNHWWTSFGPTTVAMHSVSTALELGDVDTALAKGSRLDTSALPIERRVRHKLDLARAHHERGHRDEAVGLVLDADELAPEQVGSHYITRSLVTAWIKTGREGASRPVADLAQRLQIV